MPIEEENRASNSGTSCERNSSQKMTREHLQTTQTRSERNTNVIQFDATTSNKKLFFKAYPGVTFVLRSLRVCVVWRCSLVILLRGVCSQLNCCLEAYSPPRQGVSVSA